MPPDAQKVAAELAIQIEAMRMARQVDHETLAAKDRRIVELELLVRDGHVLVGRYVGSDEGLRAWRHHALRACGSTFPTVPVGTPRDTRGVEVIADEQRQRVAARLAEGTRDEDAPARCAHCKSPLSVFLVPGVRRLYCQVCEEP
jgi:hypothetical protein